jgi:hypothetical protein
MNRSMSSNAPTNPSPRQGVGEFGRPRRFRKSEIAGSNPAALTIIIPTSTTAAVAQQSWS